MDNILAKIKKLQALATNNSNAAEAASAAAKASALMFEHNITSAQVETHEPPEQYEKIEHALDANRATLGWKQTLMYVVAKYNFCTSVKHTGSTRMSLIGKRSNVEAVLYLYAVCEREISRLGKAEARTQLTQRALYEHSFCRGAVSTIHERLRAQRAAQETTAATQETTALALRNTTQELALATKQFFPRLRHTRSRVSNHSDAFARGKAAGHHIGLHAGVTRQSAGYLQ
jgi:hypothetical protein